MNSRFYRSYILSCLLLVTLAACGCTDTQGSLKTVDIRLIRKDGSEEKLVVEIADTDESRASGLMHREKLDDGQGMLFIFHRDQPLSFWMKNTLIPLSIAYIASDGTILEIHDMEPGSLNPVRSARSARYALEVPQGWFDRIHVAPGDRLGLPLP